MAIGQHLLYPLINRKQLPPVSEEMGTSPPPSFVINLLTAVSSNPLGEIWIGITSQIFETIDPLVN